MRQSLLSYSSMCKSMDSNDKLLLKVWLNINRVDERVRCNCKFWYGITKVNKHNNYRNRMVLAIKLHHWVQANKVIL